MKKGITLISVMSTVAIMFILISTVTISAFNITNNTQKTKFATEIAYIKEAVDNYYTLNNSYPIGESVNVVPESNDQFDGETQNNDKVTLYIIDKTKIGITETVYGNKNQGNNDDEKATDIYVFSKDTKRVYYLKGLDVGGQVYYTLTDDLKKLINYNEKSQNPDLNETIENDNNAPQISIGEKKEIISTDENEKYYYVPVNVVDNESGIKIVKFEREIMSEENAKVYFKTNGIELQEEIIEFNVETKGVTVYAEDNDGNITIQSKNLEGEESE